MMKSGRRIKRKYNTIELPEKYRIKMGLIEKMTEGKLASACPAITAGVLLKFIVDLEERIEALEKK